MKKNPNTAMSTMTSTVNRLTNEGFTESFQVTDEGLKALSDDTLHKASDIAISNFYRFEGQSDPADNAIVYAIETNDGKKGILIDAFGTDADADIGEFVSEVQEIQKKIKS